MPVDFDQFPAAHRPRLIVMSVAHSGSTPIAKALALCGWLHADPNHDCDRRAECSRIIPLNNAIIRNLDGRAEANDPPLDELRHSLRCELAALPDAYVVKDPRWCRTLPEIDCLADQYSLVWLQRESDEVLRSFDRRSQFVTRNGLRVHGASGRSVAELHGLCRENFDRWPGAKWIIRYEDVLQAVSSGSRGRFISALGIGDYGPFARESIELAMSVISPDVSSNRERTSGWDATGKFSRDA